MGKHVERVKKKNSLKLNAASQDNLPADTLIGCVSHAPDWGPQPGMCPDWESNG